MDPLSIQIDDDREWVQWWIEDEEYWQDLEQHWRDNVPGYRPYETERGVIEDEISE